MNPSKASSRQKVKHVVFDLGGVLLEWKPDKILLSVFADADVRSRVKREVFEHEDWLLLDRGKMDEEVALRRFAERTGTSVEDMKRLMAVVRKSLVPVPKTFELFHELYAQGFKLYCLSNLHAKNYSFLKRRYNFWEFLSGSVISAEVGLVKPERAIYKYLLDTYKLKPAATVFIDDIRKNVEVAQKLGMHGILFTTVIDCREELHELPGMDSVKL